MEIGMWVQVRRGTYRGDVGYVLSVAASDVHLLLIPRLARDSSRSKRKRSRIRPALKLFDHKTHQQYYAIEPRRIHEDIYSVGNDRFEHGLIVRSYSFDSVSTRVSTIPLESFSLFRSSFHPEIISSKSAFPRPTEWYFAEGEEACVGVKRVSLWDPSPPSYKTGYISKLRDDAAELDTKEGIVIVPWMDICKVVCIGDFVEVTGGLHKEQRGWVDQVDLEVKLANIIAMADDGKPFDGEVRPKLCK
jgi:hypothetical protein